MAEIIWLASYPKSGNTWLRILLTNYLCAAAEPADINNLGGGPIASSRIWFDEWSGIESSNLKDNVIERLRPDIYRCMAREEVGALFVKVHDAWCRTDHGEGLFPEDVTAGVIYVIRNPLDMAASCANHWGVSIAQAVDNLCDTNFTLARSLGGMSDQLCQKLGNWSDHLVSWLDESGLSVHLVRYEDMRLDPEHFFGHIISFCNLPFDVDRLRSAVKFSEFGELQRQEKEKGFNERSKKSTEAFFRKGRVGGWREELSKDLVRKLIDSHGEAMRRFGYLDENNNPI